MKAAERPLESAVAAIDEITANAKIREGFERFVVANAAVFYNSGTLHGDQKRDFSNYLKLKSADATIFYRALLILVCTTYEVFWKQVIQNIIQEMSAAATSFDKLPERLVAANFAYTGQYFNSKRSEYSLPATKKTFEQMTSQLTSCRENSKKYDLNHMVFTEFMGNCTPNQLEKRFEEIGILEPFGDAIAGAPELRSFFGGGGTRDVAKKTKVELEQLIDRRNALVHSSSGAETVTIDELMQAVSLVRAYSHSVARHITGINLGN